MFDVTTLTTDYLHYAYPSKEYLLFEDNSYTRAFLHGRVTLEESWLNKWKKSPAAQCKCQMCKVVKELELDENTSHINLFVDKGTHEKGHGYKLNAYDARKRKEKEHESGAAKKKQKTLMPLFGGKPHVLYHAAPDVITSDRRGQQWKMAFRQAEAETRTFLPEYNGPTIGRGYPPVDFVVDGKWLSTGEIYSGTFCGLPRGLCHLNLFCAHINCSRCRHSTTVCRWPSWEPSARTDEISISDDKIIVMGMSARKYKILKQAVFRHYAASSGGGG
jgi:hypothetical protein